MTGLNYEKIYNKLINRGKNRLLDDYTEIHHIIPKCMGGSDESNNLVKLTPEEHYIAHQLLAKIHPKNNALAMAVLMMTVNRSSNKLYGWVRRRHSEAMKVIQAGKNNSQYGSFWIFNPETKESIKIKNDNEIPAGWVKGRKVKKKTQLDLKKEQNKKEKQKRIDNLKQVMYYYRDNDITMRELTAKFNLGHNVYVSFERYFKEEYREIVKTKKGNSNITKGRY